MRSPDVYIIQYCHYFSSSVFYVFPHHTPYLFIILILEVDYGSKTHGYDWKLKKREVIQIFVFRSFLPACFPLPLESNSQLPSVNHRLH